MIRASLAAWMKSVDQAGGPSTETLAAPAFAQPQSELVSETERLITVSYLLGRDHAGRPLDLSDYDELPFEEAVAFMKARVPLTKSEWNSLEPKLRFRAFTVAALSSPDAIERVRKSAISAVESGKTLSEFWTDTMADDEAQLSGKNPGYWENVYRTNTQTAYNAGRAAEFMATNPEYLEFIGIEDTRQTDICAERSGVVLPATHSFWKSNWPPLHFQCRSTVRAIYREEADMLREQDPEWRPTKEDDLDGILGAASGFGGNPIDSGSFWMLTPKMIERAQQYGIIDDIKAFAKQLGLKRYTLKAAPQAVKTAAVAAAKVETPAIDTSPVFKTVKEAERWIVDNDLADAASFKGCDLRVVQEWAASLKSILAEYPEARKSMQFFGTIQERGKKLLGILEEKAYAQLIDANVDEYQARALARQWAKEAVAKLRTAPGTIAQFSAYEGIIGISVNEKYAKSYDTFLRIRKSDVASGFKPIGTDKVVATLEHEMGHALDHVYGLAKSPELLLYYRTLSRQEIAEGLSSYATKNIGEFIAEGWSEYRCSPAPREIARKVGELLIAEGRKLK